MGDYLLGLHAISVVNECSPIRPASSRHFFDKTRDALDARVWRYHGNTDAKNSRLNVGHDAHPVFLTR
jgi:hypothetical protein